MTDFGGAMTRSVSDLADMLNVVTGIDPDDPATLARPAGAFPADWRSALDTGALQGKRIGYVDSAWADVFGSTSALRHQRHDRRDEDGAAVPRGRPALRS